MTCLHLPHRSHHRAPAHAPGYAQAHTYTAARTRPFAERRTWREQGAETQSKYALAANCPAHAVPAFCGLTNVGCACTFPGTFTHTFPGGHAPALANTCKVIYTQVCKERGHFGHWPDPLNCPNPGETLSNPSELHCVFSGAANSLTSF